MRLRGSKLGVMMKLWTQALSMDPGVWISHVPLPVVPSKEFPSCGHSNGSDWHQGCRHGEGGSWQGSPGDLYLRQEHEI